MNGFIPHHSDLCVCVCSCVNRIKERDFVLFELTKIKKDYTKNRRTRARKKRKYHITLHFHVTYS